MMEISLKPCHFYGNKKYLKNLRSSSAIIMITVMVEIVAPTINN